MHAPRQVWLSQSPLASRTFARALDPRGITAMPPKKRCAAGLGNDGGLKVPQASKEAMKKAEEVLKDAAAQKRMRNQMRCFFVA